jgi:AmmeMemoRadiSam system protein B
MLDEFPKLRPLNLRWVQWEGRQVLLLQDPLRLSDSVVMVPQPMAPLLSLLDGKRDPEAVRVSFLLRSGVPLLPRQIEIFIQSLDHAFLLDNQRFRHALRGALSSYHSGPFRTPALAGGGYSEDQGELLSALDGYCLTAERVTEDPSGTVVGLVSPHIDYARGWRTYADTWQRARKAVEEAELVILLGTDHSGAPGSLTLTRQNYATPWGVLPTDVQLVDRLATILGEERAFAEEVHHIGEHSIELAAVWLHYVAGRQPKPLLPILCGPNETTFSNSGDDVENGDAGRLRDILDSLMDIAAGPRVLVVAAGDLSHVGPAFGDSVPMDFSGKARIRAWDHEWLDVACSGNSDLLVEHLLQRGDPTRICGAAPIHYMLSVLQGARGRVVAYEQCPADEQFGSLVSVAGVLFSV